MITQYTIAILFAVLYAALEQFIKKHGYADQHDFFCFSYYHLMMLGLFILACFPLLKLLPLMMLVEDIFFFIFYPKRISPDSWIAEMFGYIQYGRFVFPFAYLLLAGAYALLEYFY